VRIALEADAARYLFAVQRGYQRRLGADRFYPGLTAKNPLHPTWLVSWPRSKPYTLDELARWLEFEDMRPYPKGELSGFSRDCDCFDQTRWWAYEHVIAYRASGGTEAGWVARCREVAAGFNAFKPPLGPASIRAIGKSVGQWTWRRYSSRRRTGSFSKRQALRGKRGMAKRWDGHIAAETTKPWEAKGIGRATYYRRRVAERAAAAVRQ
jgi:hypothetical protein